ncbi:hypothetical protein TNCV_574301 [Trichonephila clavipes]|nr:hypothetical protein TNCV_574301 [Trichonephila clavipes]
MHVQKERAAAFPATTNDYSKIETDRQNTLTAQEKQNNPRCFHPHCVMHSSLTAGDTIPVRWCGVRRPVLPDKSESD